MRHGVIMAGGAGTRLWPLSRADRPKQLLQVGSGQSLLGLAYERLAGVVPAESIFVCTLDAHREAVLAALPSLPPDNVIGEPAGRDTAAAVGYCATVLAATDPDAVLAVVTADHVIEPVASFHGALRAAFQLAETAPRLVTFGVVPTSPHTGLGYVERGEPIVGASATAYDVASFKEKPDAETAAAYLASGRFLWNSGMFVWRADVVLAQLRDHRPELAERLAPIGAAAPGPDRERAVAAAYADLPKISVDYAIMEPAAARAGDAVAVVPLEVDWLDVGSWTALATTLPVDAHGNAVRGLTVLVDSARNVVVTDDPDHLVAAVGLQDTVVVATRDVTMVCPRTATERVKELVAAVQAAQATRFT